LPDVVPRQPVPIPLSYFHYPSTYLRAPILRLRCPLVSLPQHQLNTNATLTLLPLYPSDLGDGEVPVGLLVRSLPRQFARLLFEPLLFGFHAPLELREVLLRG
jgi:hypothetical protein